MALIDHTNFSTTLKQSTAGRGGAVDGNIYFDVANNEIQLIGVDELATIIYPVGHPSYTDGTTPVANPLSQASGITMRALYNFENTRRRADETLRKYKRGTDGDYRFAGAFSFVNGVKLDVSTVNDRAKIRGSGFIEYAVAGDGATTKDRIYHGVKSLIDIQSGTTSYSTLVTDTAEATLQAATWTNFTRTGPIDEVVQVFGTTANGDTTAGNFDYTARTLVVRTRSWGYNAGETTSVASGITEFSGNSAGYGVGETLNPQNSYDIANVYGGAKIVPWTGMTLTGYTSPTTQTGFVDGSATFTYVLANSAGGTVQQVAAYLDALALQDSDIDSDGLRSYNGKKGRIWYTRDAEGKVVTSAGLFVGGLTPVEQQKIKMTDNAGGVHVYPYFPSVEISMGTLCRTDPDAWYHVYYTSTFDSAGAITVLDASATPVEVKGLCSTLPANGVLSFVYDYSGNTQGGLSGDRACTVEVEGNGIVAQALTEFTIKEQDINAVSCIPFVENNS